MRWRSMWPLLAALLVSLLLHLGMLGSGLVSFNSLDMPDEPPLRKMTAKLQGVALAAAAQAPRAAVALQPVSKGGIALPQASAPAVASPRHRSSPVASAPQATAAPASATDASAPSVQVADAASAPVTASAPVSAAVSPASERVLPERQLARFPDAAHLRYGLLNHGILLGAGDMNWQRNGGDYRIVTTVKPLIGPALRYETSGKVGRNGLQPLAFAATRNEQPREFARFDWSGGVLEYGDKETRQIPLQAGALDWLSLGFELALRGEQPGAARQITTGKKVYQFDLQVAGEADFDTGDGMMRVVVVRARNDKDLIEFWLAPDFANIPVRIMRVDNDKRFELRATLIEFNGAAVWKQPSPQRPTNHEN